MIGIKNFPAALMTAGNAVTFNCHATFIRCLTGNASMKLECYRGGDKVIDFDGFQAGLKIGPIYEDNAGDLQSGQATRNVIIFDQVILTNGSTGQQIVLAYGDGEVEDNRLVGTVNITGGLLSKSLGEDTSDGFGTVTVANGAATLIKAAGTQAGQCLVQNVGSVDCYLGWTNTVTNTNGIKLTPGSSVSLSGGIAIYGYGQGGTVDVRYMAGKFA